MSSQVTVRVTRDGKTLDTLSVEPGAVVVGRDSSCDLQLDDRKVSRRHCEIRLEPGRLVVTDLGSSNGTRLGDTQLRPKKALTWATGVPLHVGPFTLQVSSAPVAGPSPATPAAVPRLVTRRIVCGQAVPSVLVLGDKPITVGRDAQCDMVLADRQLSRRQCEISQQRGQVWVKDLSGRGSTRVGADVLAAGVPHIWPEGELLSLGPFSVVHTADVETPARAPSLAAIVPPDLQATSDIGSRMWLEWVRHLPWVPIVLALGGVCLVLGIGVGVARLILPTATPATSATSALTPGPIVAEATPAANPTATEPPTATPTSTPVLTQGSGTTLQLPTETPLPTLVCTPQTAGWLELPFPYDGRNRGFGNADQFREVSQRAASGGRITSFFDHEYPLYSRGEAQYEGTQVRDTLVLFDGSRSLNKWAYPDQIGDYYSGHPGIDYVPFEWGKSTTPALAPAEGTFLAAGIDNLGNYFVHIVHDRGNEGVYRTSYLHLENDEHFQRMLALTPGAPIALGERIGTIGNTGNSTGHHLHFEVRRDCNADGTFALAEAIDPYGFIPSVEIPIDPLALAELPCGASLYLWKHTLEPAEEGGGCAQPERRWQLDPAPFQGFVSIATFIFTTADPTTPTRVRVWLADADVEKVDIQSVKVHRYEIEVSGQAGNWVVVPESRVRLGEAKVYVEVDLNVPGKYTVTGKPLKDIIPPSTTIKLSGPQQGEKYVGTVTVELIGEDESAEGVREIRYSVDCGQIWETYGDRPFTLTRDDFAVCRRGDDPQGDEWGLEEDQYLILAAAADWAGNWEQPPSQRQLTLVAAGDTG